MPEKSLLTSSSRRRTTSGDLSPILPRSSTLMNVRTTTTRSRLRSSPSSRSSKRSSLMQPPSSTKARARNGLSTRQLSPSTTLSTTKRLLEPSRACSRPLRPSLSRSLRAFSRKLTKKQAVNWMTTSTRSSSNSTRTERS